MADISPTRRCTPHRQRRILASASAAISGSAWAQLLGAGSEHEGPGDARSVAVAALREPGHADGLGEAAERTTVVR
jgi:hypothetical protein